MKTLLILFFHFSIINTIIAQNVGIGTTEPVTKLHLVGSMLVNESTFITGLTPTPAQTITLINNTTSTFLGTDSTGVIYDPAGPAANYAASMIAYAQVNNGLNVGVELNFRDLDLGIGDSLIITESISSTNPPLLAVGNGYSYTGKININSRGFYLTFKSNGDGNIGRGVDLLFKRLYSNAALMPEVKGYSGRTMFYNAKKGAFRSGSLNNSLIGEYSFAGGFSHTASGAYSTALGYTSTASGNYAVAAGYGAVASGNYSTAMGGNAKASNDGATAFGDGTVASGAGAFATGIGTNASGTASTALGNNSSAIGNMSLAVGNFCYAYAPSSIAMGSSASASGANSFAVGNFSSAIGANSITMGTNVSAQGANAIAIGSYVSTGYFSGSLIIGDASTTTNLGIVSNNSFRARFANGYGFFTGPSTGVWVAAGGNSWAAISDIKLKENFLPVNGEDVLTSIAHMPQYTWNYIGQDSKTFRHYGPMAQDFYKAFGRDDLGEIGCDTMINQQDFLGVNLIAIQALEKRTALLQQENELLKQKNDLLEVRLRKLEMRRSKK